MYVCVCGGIHNLVNLFLHQIPIDHASLPGTMLGAGDKAIKETDRDACNCKVYILAREDKKKKYG